MDTVPVEDALSPRTPSPRILWITPHISFSNTITIHDLTSAGDRAAIIRALDDESGPAPSTPRKTASPSAYTLAARAAAHLLAADTPPLYTLRRTRRLGDFAMYSTETPSSSSSFEHTATSPTGSTSAAVAPPPASPPSPPIATWHPSHASSQPNIFTFPLSSPHGSHPITQRRARVFLSRAETLVVDSAPLEWRYDEGAKLGGRRRVTLWHKGRGGGEGGGEGGGADGGAERLARFRGRWPAVKIGGVVVLEEGCAVAEVIVVLGVCAILRRDRE